MCFIIFMFSVGKINEYFVLVSVVFISVIQVVGVSYKSSSFVVLISNEIMVIFMLLKWFGI